MWSFFEFDQSNYLSKLIMTTIRPSIASTSMVPRVIVIPCESNDDAQTRPITQTQLLAQPITTNLFMRAITQSSARDYSLAFMAIDKADDERLATDERQVIRTMFARPLPHQLIALYILRCMHGRQSIPYIIDVLTDFAQNDPAANILKRVLTSRDLDKPGKLSTEWITLLENVISSCNRTYALPILQYASKLTASDSRSHERIILREHLRTIVRSFTFRAVSESPNDTYTIMVALYDFVEAMMPGTDLIKDAIHVMRDKIDTRASAQQSGDIARDDDILASVFDILPEAAPREQSTSAEPPNKRRA